MKMTRRELAPFLTSKGFKTSVSKLNRICSPAVNQGPPVVGRWGGSDLYDDETSLEWAEARAAAAKDKPRYAVAPEHIGRKKPERKNMPIASSKPARAQRRA